MAKKNLQESWERNENRSGKILFGGVGLSTLTLVIWLALNPKSATDMNVLMPPVIGWMFVNMGIYLLFVRHLVESYRKEKVVIKEQAKVKVEGLKFVEGCEVKMIDQYKFDELVETYRIKEYKDGFVLLISSKGSSSQVSLKELVEKYQAV